MAAPRQAGRRAAIAAAGSQARQAGAQPIQGRALAPQTTGTLRNCTIQAVIRASALEGELALLLLRMYRSLHALYGGDQSLMRHWIAQPNHHLGEQPPRLLLARIEGLNRVANHLDALRG